MWENLRTHISYELDCMQLQQRMTIFLLGRCQSPKKVANLRRSWTRARCVISLPATRIAQPRRCSRVSCPFSRQTRCAGRGRPAHSVGEGRKARCRADSHTDHHTSRWRGALKLQSRESENVNVSAAPTSAREDRDRTASGEVASGPSRPASGFRINLLRTCVYFIVLGDTL